MKIFGGEAKGLSLFFSKSKLCRPTLALLKRRVFDSFQNFDKKIFIDAFAGTGSIGLEALSRGAESLYLIEISKKQFSLLEKNLNKIVNSYSHFKKKRYYFKK